MPSRGLILGVLCIGAFAFPLAAFIVGPLLVDLSDGFGVSLAAAGQLATLAAVPSAVLALLIGPLSDRYGRRPILVSGSLLLGVTSLGSAVAPTYEVMAATRVLSGAGAAMLGPTAFAAVADLFPYQQRGRAYGILLAALNISTILGIPAVTLVAAQWGWRWAFGLVGVVVLGSFVALLLLYPAGRLESDHAEVEPDGDDPPTGQAPRPSGLRDAFIQGYLPVLHSRSAVIILGSTLGMSIGWMAFQTYLGAFFIHTYQTGTGGLAPILALSGVGVLIGSQVGGRLGDRIGHKPITIWSIVAATVLVVALLGMVTSLEMATAINFVLSVPMGMRFTSMSVLISEAAPAARGTMNALNSTFFNIGLLFGSFSGGVIVEGIGFAGLAILVAVGHIGSVLVLARFLVEHRDPPLAAVREA